MEEAGRRVAEEVEKRVAAAMDSEAVRASLQQRLAAERHILEEQARPPPGTCPGTDLDAFLPSGKALRREISRNHPSKRISTELLPAWRGACAPCRSACCHPLQGFWSETLRMCGAHSRGCQPEGSRMRSSVTWHKRPLKLADLWQVHRKHSKACCLAWCHSCSQGLKVGFPLQVQKELEEERKQAEEQQRLAQEAIQAKVAELRAIEAARRQEVMAAQHPIPPTPRSAVMQYFIH